MDAWEIVTYGNGEFLRDTFNNVVMIMGDDNYAILIKILMLVGFLWMMTGAAFNMKIMSAPVWLLSAIMVMYVLLIPRVNVMIIDRINPGMNSVVANVPIGIGVPASFISQLGDWMTTSYETVFSMPDDMNYSKNGMLFGQRLVEASTRIRILDGRVQGNFQEFFNTCVLYDVGLGLYSWTDLQNSGDLWEFLQGNTSQVRRYYHRSVDGSGDLKVCRESAAANGPLDEDLKAALNNAQRRFSVQQLSRKILASMGFESSQAIDNATASQAFAEASTLTVSTYNHLAKLSADAATIMRQNIMINAVRDAAQGAAIANDSAAAAISYAVARAEAERRATWRTMGELSMRTLPILRNVFEGVMYAVFPLAMLMAMVVPKQALMSYGKVLIWIQLWAPMYAILHNAMSRYSSYASAGVLYDGSGASALTMQTSGALGEVMADTGYVAGYLMMSIPMIAWMLVNQGGMMMTSLAGGVMTGIQGIAARAADEATTGNISLGNNSQDNINWFKQDTSAMDNRGYGSSMGADGLQRTLTQHGQVLGNSPVSAQATEQTVSSLKAGHSRSIQAAEQHGAAYMDSMGAAQNDLTRLSQGINNGTVNSQGWDQTTKAEFNESWSEVEKLGEKFEKQHGLEAGTGVKALAYVKADASAGGSWKSPGWLSFLTGAEAQAGVSAGAGVKTEADAQVRSKELFQAAQNFAKETGFSEVHSRAVSAGEKLATENREDVTRGLGTDISANLATTQTHQQNWQASQTEAQGYQAALEEVNSRGGSLGIDLSGPLQDYLATHYGSHARAEEVQAKVRTNAATPAEVANLMTAVSQFGRDYADVYARGFTQSDLGKTYDGADKPQLDTRNVPGREPLQASHDQTAGRIQQQATDAGVSTIATVEQHAAAIQGGAQQEIQDQKDRLDHLRVETEMAGKERQGEIEPTAHASAAAEAARRTTEPLVNQIVDSQNAVHGNRPEMPFTPSLNPGIEPPVPGVTGSSSVPERPVIPRVTDNPHAEAANQASEGTVQQTGQNQIVPSVGDSGQQVSSQPSAANQVGAALGPVEPQASPASRPQQPDPQQAGHNQVAGEQTQSLRPEAPPSSSTIVPQPQGEERSQPRGRGARKNQ